MRGLFSFFLSCVFIFFWFSPVFATGFAITPWSARGIGLGGGLVGRADDPSAVAYNPAGITQLAGTHLLFGAATLTPSGDVYTQDTGSTVKTSSRPQTFVTPHAYGTHQLNDDFWFGIGLFSRFGLGVTYPGSWAGRQSVTSVTLETFSLNPVLAWKATDNLSLAVGFELMGTTIDLKADAQIAPGVYNAQHLEGMGVAPVFNAALHYTFNEQWAMGLSYRSRTVQKIKGDNKWDLEFAGTPLQNSDAHGNLHLPDVLSFGVAYSPTDRLSFELSASYTVWSAYRSFNIYLEAPSSSVVHSSRDWHDTWGAVLSVEYQPTDLFVLRAAYGYESNPMEASTVDYMVPAGSSHDFSLGAGVLLNDWTIDLGYTYAIFNGVDFDSSHTAGVVQGFSDNGKMHTLALSASYAF